jgi:hypothetical protein
LGIGAATRQAAPASVGPRQRTLDSLYLGIHVHIENFRSQGQNGTDDQSHATHQNKRGCHVMLPEQDLIRVISFIKCIKKIEPIMLFFHPFIQIPNLKSQITNKYQITKLKFETPFSRQ